MWRPLRRAGALAYRGDLFVEQAPQLRDVVLTPLQFRVLPHTRGNLVFFKDGAVFVTYTIVRGDQDGQKLATFWRALQGTIADEEYRDISFVASGRQFDLLQPKGLWRLRSMLRAKVHAYVRDEGAREMLLALLTDEPAEELYGVMLTLDDAKVVMREKARVYFRRSASMLHCIDDEVRDAVVGELDQFHFMDGSIRIRATCTLGEHLEARLKRVVQNSVPPWVRVDVVAKPQQAGVCTVCLARLGEARRVDLSGAASMLADLFARAAQEHAFDVVIADA